MKRQFDAACRQYTVKEAQGDGRAEWADGLKCGFPSVKLLGKTEQKSYTGKNLFDTSRIPELTLSGDNHVSHVSTNQIIIALCSNDAGNGFTNSTKKLGELAPNLTAGKEYTLSFESESSSQYIYLSGFNNTWRNGECKTVDESMLDSRVIFYGMATSKGDPATDCRISNIQIEEGEAVTVYEHYVGGVPSPNPLYPQEVEGNHATVRSYGKNLFNTSLIPVQSEVISTGSCWISEVGDDYVVVSESDIYEWSGNVGTGRTLRQLAPGLVVGHRYTLQFETESSKQSGILLAEAQEIWTRGHSMEITEELLASEVRLFGKSVYHGETAGDCRIFNIQIEEGTVVTAYEPYHDGGEATAPNLMCAVDGSCQSTYDPQTGEFVNWWWDKITLDGSEKWTAYSITYPAGDGANGFYAYGVLPERMSRNAYWSNQTPPGAKESWDDNGAFLWCGVNSLHLFALDFGCYDDTLEDFGLANWKAHLAEHPLEVWVARNEPEITNIGPNRLTCPTGSGQIVQVAGDIPDCPLEVKYLAHGGNVK